MPLPGRYSGVGIGGGGVNLFIRRQNCRGAVRLKKTSFLALELALHCTTMMFETTFVPHTLLPPSRHHHFQNGRINHISVGDGIAVQEATVQSGSENDTSS